MISDWALNWPWAFEFEHYWGMEARVVRGTKCGFYKYPLFWFVSFANRIKRIRDKTFCFDVRLWPNPWALIGISETPNKGLTLPFFTSISIVSLLYAILTPLFVIFAYEPHCILLFIIILVSKTSFFIIYVWIKNAISSSSFAILLPLCW